MTLEELRRLVDEISYEENDNSVIANGMLHSPMGEVAFKIHQEWNPVCANRCDSLWGAFNISLLRHVRDVSASEEELKDLYEALSLEDQHWDWFSKAASFKSESYRWFFLIANGEPQGACLIYHPKESIIDKRGIFYIEYIAVAPWNRKNPLDEVRFSGVGSLLLKHVSAYAISVFGIRPGFGLHSLPKAYGFYQRIGMCNYPVLDKDVLKYYEMPEQVAEKFIGVVQ